MQGIAIVIPIYKQFPNLSPEEKISLWQTYRVLHKYDICFVTHREINSKAYYEDQVLNLKIKTFIFDKSYFADIAGYNRLLLGFEFYKTFEAYTHILICQLDVFVFSDLLDQFVNKKYDYIGAPWFEGHNAALKTSTIIGAGNGGFSLRKVNSFLRVLNLFKLFKHPFLAPEGVKELFLQPKAFLKIVKHSFLLRSRTYIPIVPWQFPQYEDLFWSIYVKQFFPWFKVGNIEDSIAFSFEVNPDVLFELNKKKLPMGTHAWEKYDREFWKPHIEKFGFSL